MTGARQPSAAERARLAQLRRWTTTLLAQELSVATGCTEPAAIAFGVCSAARALGQPVEAIDLEVDTGTFKNSLSVGLPGTSLRGPQAAAAIGACLTDQAPGLSLLAHADAARWQDAAALLAGGRVTVTPIASAGLAIRARVSGGGHQARADLQRRHDRLVHLEVDGQRRWPGPVGGIDVLGDDGIADALADAATIVEHAEALDDASLEPVGRALALNLAVVADAPDAVRTDPARLTAFAIQRRMDGDPVAVATSAGSGNSGLTISLALAALIPESEPRRRRALALAHLVNVAVKTRIGRVGPLCGGVVASATAVGCALAWLEGGGAEAVDDVIRTMVDTLAGAVCDGANRTCAPKIGTALTTAIAAAQSAIEAPGTYAGNGLGGKNAREAFANLAGLAEATGPRLDLALVNLLHRDLDRSA